MFGARVTRPDKRRGRARGLRDESGVVAVEFALTLPLILLVFFMIIEFSQVFNNLNDLNQIAANGARFAAVNNIPSGSGSLQSRLEGQADTQRLRDGIDVCVDFPSGSSNVGEPVHVRATSSYTLLPIVNGATLNLHGEATMRIERAPTNYSQGC
jgi:hypothetical protein